MLYSATANEIRSYGDCVLDLNFKTPQNCSWNFTKTNLNFSIVGLNFLNAHKLTIDIHNRCLVDKENDVIISLSPASVPPPKLCCIVHEQSEFHQILAKYPISFSLPIDLNEPIIGLNTHFRPTELKNS